MSDRKQALIDQARARYGEIHPCATKGSIEECFTEEPRYGLILWCNDASGSTRAVIEKRTT